MLERRKYFTQSSVYIMRTELVKHLLLTLNHKKLVVENNFHSDAVLK